MATKADYQRELDALLSESPAAVALREQTAFDSLFELVQSHGIVLFGSGPFGQRTAAGLHAAGFLPVAFCDNNPARWSTQVSGIPVLSPEEACRKHPKAVFIVTIWSDVSGHPVDEISKQLSAYGSIRVHSFFELFWKFHTTLLPYFSIDLPHKTIADRQRISQAFQLFEDEISQKEFVAQIRFRLHGDFRALTKPAPGISYVHNDCVTTSSKERFVDIGAFDGDTLKLFTPFENNFERYYAFEPDPLNFQKLNAMVHRMPMAVQNKVKLYGLAVSNAKKQIRFASTGSLQSAASSSGNITVDCVALDEWLAGETITFIKVDAEGAEGEILEGAAQIIGEDQPVLAVSSYHVYHHLWTLPLQIRELNKDYSFFLRPHCPATWDLIVYAVPRHRLKSI